MPSAKSARVSERRRVRNAPLRTRAKTFVTRARRLIVTNDLAGAEQAVAEAVVSLDKAAQKGVLHRNNASRRKSRIMKMLHRAKSTQ
ncbi:MAG: 30S ribosomal protein S20 [Chloroflexi bacterium]|nr:30S ribosomal protein S20 [Chloroflexota bacterium]